MYKLSYILIITVIITSCYKDEPNNNSQYETTTYTDNTIGKLYTNFSEDWDSWRIELSGETGIVKTSFSEDWDNWGVYGEFPEDYTIEQKIVSMFIPMFTGAIQNQGINQ